MPNRSTVVVVGASPEVELALDSLRDLSLPIRLIPTAGEALRTLERTPNPELASVLVDMRRDTKDGLAIIRLLRKSPRLRSVPIVVWADSDESIDAAYDAGATSGILLLGVEEDSIQLASVVYYWAVANEPFAERLT